MQFLHQMFNVSALLLDDTLKPATPLTNGVGHVSLSPGRRRPGWKTGRSFHSRGPAAEKLLSPSLLCVYGTSSFWVSLE